MSGSLGQLQALLGTPEQQRAVVQYVQENHESLAQTYPHLVTLVGSIGLPDQVDESTIDEVSESLFAAFGALSADEQAAVHSEVSSAIGALNLLAPALGELVSGDDSSAAYEMQADYELDLLEADLAADAAALAGEADGLDAAF
eukprot:tig00021326_g20267.t1